MYVSKTRISSPLEAGTSILDAHNLPSHLTDALEYVSSRLARKALHVTLVVVRKENSPISTIPYSRTSSMASSTASLSASTTNSPHQIFSPTQPFSPATPASASSAMSFARSLKQRLRSAHPTLPGLGSPVASHGGSGGAAGFDEDFARSAAPSPAFSVTSHSSTASSSCGSMYSAYSSAPSRSATCPLPQQVVMPAASPLTPASANSSQPPPMTPCSTASSTTDASQAAAGGRASESGIHLVYADQLSVKDEKAVRDGLVRAERKFNIGREWLPKPMYPAACGLTDSIIRRSLVQNEVQFASEGLTLFALDRLYTFKAALSSYSRTGSRRRLEDAVDELRRLHLTQGGRTVSRADILRSFDWLTVTDAALADADRMYRRAYGGGVYGVIDGVKPAVVDEISLEINEAIDDVAVRIRGDDGDFDGMGMRGNYGDEEDDDDDLDDGPIFQHPRAFPPLPPPPMAFKPLPALPACAGPPATDAKPPPLPPPRAVGGDSGSNNNATTTTMTMTTTTTSVMIDALPSFCMLTPQRPTPTISIKAITAAGCSIPAGAPSPPLPRLTLQTNFHVRPGPIREKGLESAVDEDEDDDLTARPKEPGERAFQSVRGGGGGGPPVSPVIRVPVAVAAKRSSGVSIASFATVTRKKTHRVVPLQMWQNVSIDEMIRSGGPPTRALASSTTPPAVTVSKAATAAAAVDPEEQQQQQMEEPMSAVSLVSRSVLSSNDDDEIDRMGPMTPNGYDDISPVTRGEWGFLFASDSGFKGAKTVGVTTF